MSFLAEMLVGEQIRAVWVDSEITYIMLANGTQVTIRGWMVVEPKRSAGSEPTDIASVPDGSLTS